MHVSPSHLVLDARACPYALSRVTNPRHPSIPFSDSVVHVGVRIVTRILDRRLTVWKQACQIYFYCSMYKVLRSMYVVGSPAALVASTSAATFLFLSHTGTLASLAGMVTGRTGRSKPLAYPTCIPRYGATWKKKPQRPCPQATTSTAPAPLYKKFHPADMSRRSAPSDSEHESS